MKPQVDLERKGRQGLSDYGAASLLEPKASWTTQEMLLLASLMCVICSTVGSTYYYWALLPAWEADRTLQWTKSTTMLISWSSTLAEAAGLLVAGPLSDYVEPIQLILFDTTLALAGVLVTSLLLVSPEGIVINLFIVAFAKGVLWPAVGATVFQLIPREKQDVCIFCAALASRFAGGFGDLLIGFWLNQGMTWRHTLLVVAGVDFTFLLCALICLRKTLANGIHDASDDTADSSPLWVASYGSKWHRLVSDVRGWLALLTMMGSGTIWCLCGYLAVVLKEQFTLNSGQAAMGASSAFFGVFLGLLAAGSVALHYGKDAGRKYQLWQGAVGMLFTVTLCIFPRKGVPLTMLCLVFTGMGFGPIVYLPYTSYSASVPKSQRAFCMGTLDCLSQANQVLIKMYFGNLRITLPNQAGQIMYDFVAFGGSMALFTTSLLYSRLGKSAEDDPAMHF